MATITTNTVMLQPKGLTTTPITNVNAPRRSVEGSSLPAKVTLQGFEPSSLNKVVVTAVRRIVWPRVTPVLIGGAYIIPPTSGTMTFQWG